MKAKYCTRMLAIVLALSMAGCGIKETHEVVTEETSPEDSASDTASGSIDETANIESNTLNEAATSGEESTEAAEEAVATPADEITEELLDTPADEPQGSADNESTVNDDDSKEALEQRNSFSMMYYLAITAEEIRTSKDNRLILEDTYTSLLNDINPGAIDEITQDHLQNLRDIIKSYMNISTKRERLQFIYNQQKAAAIQSAVPDPLAVLSVSNAFDWKQLALSVAFTAVDSYNNYKASEESADMAFIMSGWELDDEEKETVMRNRDHAFDYMVDMVQEYDLDGLKTLNEKSIERFAEICATENPTERIKLLRAEEAQYNLLGNYWLELADAYYETGRYSECLDCVEQYNELSTGIYRQDYNYLQILPKAIVAAQETYTDDEYVVVASDFADAIIANTSSDDWSSRYFAAQVYLDLYSKTNDISYMEAAYKIASENVTVLLRNQRELNTTYLNAVKEQTVTEPDYRYMSKEEEKEAKKEYKAEKKRVNQYNKALKENRKTELPSLYEPLVLNCELLFALADQLDLDNAEKADIEAILKTDTSGIFMVRPINDAYSFSNSEETYSIEFTKDEMVIPVSLLTAESQITVSVEDNGKTTVFDDCKVTKVDRDGSSIDTFKAHASSKQLKKYAWTPDSEITVTITYGDACDKTVSLDYAVETYVEHWYGDKVEFTAR